MYVAGINISQHRSLLQGLRARKREETVTKVIEIGFRIFGVYPVPSGQAADDGTPLSDSTLLHTTHDDAFE